MKYLLCAGILLLGHPCLAVEVGLYFDEAATQTSCPNGLLTQQDLYLVMTGIGDDVSVAGWKAVIGHGRSTFISATDIHSGGVNRRQHPVYEVDLATPLCGSTLVLARFNIVALVPDTLTVGILDGIAFPAEQGIDYSTSPAQSGSEARATASRPATIGVVAGQLAVLAAREIVVPELRPVNKEAPRVITRRSGDGESMSLEWYEHLLYVSDFCIIGTVIDIDYRCGDLGWIETSGVGVALLDVERSYWDLGSPTTYVLLKAANIDGCGRLINPMGFDDYQIGGKYLILGEGSRGHALAYEPGVFLYSGSEYSRPAGMTMEFELPELLASEHARMRDYRQQLLNADLVAVIEVVRRIEEVDDNRTFTYRVVPDVCFKGVAGPDTLLVSYRRRGYSGWKSLSLPPPFAPGREFLVFLEKMDGEGYVPLYGDLSAVRLGPKTPDVH